MSMTMTKMSRSEASRVAGLIGESKSVLTASELQRMKDITMSDADRMAQQKALMASTKAASEQKAAMRKAKMLELEAQRKLAVPPVRLRPLVPSCRRRAFWMCTSVPPTVLPVYLQSRPCTFSQSEIEQQKLMEKEKMLSAADQQMAEELDDVKKMNQVRVCAVWKLDGWVSSDAIASGMQTMDVRFRLSAMQAMDLLFRLLVMQALETQRYLSV